MVRSAFLTLCITLTSLVPATAADWPQFRGQNGSAVSPETNLPVQWSATEGIRWQVALPGRGLSSPVIAGDRVYVTACTGALQDRLHVVCFDLATGRQLWERQVTATGTTLCHPKTCMAAPTPAADGKRVFALFATGDLVAFDRDGVLLWYRSLVGDYPTVGNNVGMAASPTIWKDVLLICMENAGESFAAGIDTRTGENRWRIERPRGINWVTPIVIGQGKDAVVVFQGPRDLSAHDPATGKKVWSIADRKFATISSPTFGDGLIFVAGDKFAAIRPGAAGDKPDVVWQSAKHATGYSSPVVYEGKLYTVSSSGVANCSDAATGQHLWAQRLQGKYAASPLAADGKVYLVSEEGVTTVMQAGADAKILDTNPLGETFLASPVAADRALFLRSDQHLWCIGKKK
jgi:outer membrane protein assembly factor BamB